MMQASKWRLIQHRNSIGTDKSGEKRAIRLKGTEGGNNSPLVRMNEARQDEVRNIDAEDGLLMLNLQGKGGEEKDEEGRSRRGRGRPEGW